MSISRFFNSGRGGRQFLPHTFKKLPSLSGLKKRLASMARTVLSAIAGPKDYLSEEAFEELLK